MMRLRLNHKGETVVEVMICLAIISLVLVSAFVLSNKNQKTNRASHERSEATKVLESQLEMLNSYTTDKKLPTMNPFCLKNTAGGVVVASTCPTGIYNIAITPSSNTNDCNGAFVIRVTWTSLVRQGAAGTTEEIKTNFKVCNRYTP